MFLPALVTNSLDRLIKSYLLHDIFTTLPPPLILHQHTPSKHSFPRQAGLLSFITRKTLTFEVLQTVVTCPFVEKVRNFSEERLVTSATS